MGRGNEAPWLYTFGEPSLIPQDMQRLLAACGLAPLREQREIELLDPAALQALVSTVAIP
jgi:hypothetical protein